MLQVARLAPNLLEDSTPLVVDFFHSQQHPDGGFRDRAGEQDIYYSVFGIEGLQALQQSWSADSWLNYVRSFGEGLDLDLVHLSCLARCWSSVPPLQRTDCPVESIVDRILAHRTPDGGYDVVPDSKTGNLYGTFVAYGAYQDLGYPIPHRDELIDFVLSLRDPEGGFFNSLDIPMTLVPQTAAALRLLKHLDIAFDQTKAAKWLMSCFHPQGGFCAGAFVPIPDLLSTATALHALAALKCELGELKELCLDFIDSLWTNRGGFYGQWEDTHVDVEYTYYAILSLGHLSLQ
jgi:prenyltransferase beta subunit